MQLGEVSTPLCFKTRADMKKPANDSVILTALKRHLG